MKISEALLYTVRESGGQIGHTQLQEWAGALIKAGFLKIEIQKGTPYYVMTQKGQQALERAGL